MGEGRKGGERRNGRNTRVWHKKNLDTGMRKAERERERKNKCRIAERSLARAPRTGEKSTKQYMQGVESCHSFGSPSSVLPALDFRGRRPRSFRSLWAPVGDDIPISLITFI